ncbi:MAG: GTPase, partial [Candidatus Kariarchaeaceae archaeon]
MRMDRYWAIVWSMIDQADVALEVVDARFPSICRSNRLEKRVMEKESCNLLIALNKSDLVPKDYLEGWISWLRKNENIRAVGVSATKRLGTSRIHKEILRASHRKTAKVAVVGLPNTGKSSLINRLRGKKAASTAPVAGHTRGQQIVNISNSITMIDTPGVIPVKLPLNHRYLMGVIPITKIKDPMEAGEVLIEEFKQIAPDTISNHYEIKYSSSDEFFEKLAIKKNKIRRGGIPDTHAAAIIL